MTRLFLDTTDASLNLIGEGHCIRSPGLAYLDAGGLVFGDAAFAQLKQSPLAVRSDFWSQLGTTPLNTGFGEARHTADLVYEHMKALLNNAPEQRALCIIAPGNMQQSQIELLLGILGSLSIDVTAVIDRALLAHPATRGSGLNLSLQWRQLIVSEIKVDAAEMSVTKVTELSGLGYLDLLEMCLENCADLCVEQTRFDPRRSAASEQQLLSAIPSLLATLGDKTEVPLDIGSTTFKVTRSSFESVARRISAAIDLTQGHISADETLSLFPGIGLDSVATSDSISNNAQGVLNSRSEGEALSRITRCALTTVTTDTTDTTAGEIVSETIIETNDAKGTLAANQSPSADDPTTEPPTHLLIDGIAYRIGVEPSATEGFGVVKSQGLAYIEASFRREITVLSVSGSHDTLPTGSRLYRSDGKEAMLIFVET
ncbi:MAG TPA: hypothetical protein DHV35_04205 [Halieaceae bacterium]|nr:hypothetical protein [Halieaceae bacterium]